jgi:hypothetical protein
MALSALTIFLSSATVFGFLPLVVEPKPDDEDFDEDEDFEVVDPQPSGMT